MGSPKLINHELKNHACLCHSLNRISYGLFWPASWMQCTECHLVWDSQFESENKFLYSEKYFCQGTIHGYWNYQADHQLHQKVFRNHLKNCEKFIQKKEHLLDVGCAFGHALEVAKSMGWKNPQGIDISPYAIKMAKKKGLKVKEGEFLNEFSAQKYDVILFNDVLEHLINPLDYLKKAYQKLDSQGVIVIVTPDLNSISAYFFKKYWFHIKPGEHICFFSSTSLSKILIELDFKIKIMRPEVSWFTMAGFLRRFPQFCSPKLVKTFQFFDFLVFPLFTGKLYCIAQKNSV